MNELTQQQEDILVFIKELQDSGKGIDSFKEAVSEEFVESDNALMPEDAYDILVKIDYVDDEFGLTFKGKQYLDSMKTRKEREEKIMEQTGNTTINIRTVKGNVNANVSGGIVEEKTGIKAHIKELTGIKNTGVEAIIQTKH